MRYDAEHKEKSRERLLVEAGRAFRSKGYGGIGVDGLAKGADLTSGAFYVHFPSKLAAFQEAVKLGMEELRAGIAGFQEKYGAGWLKKFGAFYMGDRRTCDMRLGCALPSLSAEVERAGMEAREGYEVKLREVMAEMAAGMTGTGAEKKQKAWAALALLAGGVTMARTVADPKLSEEIGAAVEKALAGLAGK